MRLTSYDELERAVLAEAITRPRALELAVDVETLDFERYDRRAVWTALRNLQAAQRPIDVLAIAAAMTERYRFTWEATNRGEAPTMRFEVDVLAQLVELLLEAPVYTDVEFEALFPGHVRRLRRTRCRGRFARSASATRPTRSTRSLPSSTSAELLPSVLDDLPARDPAARPDPARRADGPGQDGPRPVDRGVERAQGAFGRVLRARGRAARARAAHEVRVDLVAGVQAQPRSAGFLNYTDWLLHRCEDIVGDLDARPTRVLASRTRRTLWTFYRGQQFGADDLRKQILERSTTST
jgi:hypothetical protein